MTEQDYRASLEWELGIDHDAATIEARLLLANALSSLRNSNARHGGSAEQRDATKREITRFLREANARAAA